MVKNLQHEHVAALPASERGVTCVLAPFFFLAAAVKHCRLQLLHCTAAAPLSLRRRAGPSA